MASLNITGSITDKNFLSLPNLAVGDIVKVEVEAKVTALDTGAASLSLSDEDSSSEATFMKLDTESIMVRDSRNLFVHAKDKK